MQAAGFGIFMVNAVLSGRGDEIIDPAKVNLFRWPGLIAMLALLGGALGRKEFTFWPQRHERESNDDSY